MMVTRFRFVLALLIATTAACGDAPVTGDGGTDASTTKDGCGKCTDGPPTFDVQQPGDSSSDASQCPGSLPSPGSQMCSPGAPVCTYPIQTDAGQIEATCTCVPSGEDSLAYQCSEPFSQCLNSSGTMNAPFKACQQDSDCTMQRQQTDCCGSIVWVGVSKTSYAELTMCEVDWSAQFTPCNCQTKTAKTEDGNPTQFYAPSSTIHCTNNACTTTTP